VTFATGSAAYPPPFHLPEQFSGDAAHRELSVWSSDQGQFVVTVFVLGKFVGNDRVRTVSKACAAGSVGGLSMDHL
jgi:hypothetical protein